MTERHARPGDAPVFPWTTLARPAPRDGREPLTRDQIVHAALRLSDREGLDALSMRRLGQELGVAATTLYWHVRNKDEILDLILDEVVGEVRDEVVDATSRGEIDPADWRATLAATAHALRRVLVRHRNMASLMGERPTFGPKAMEALEWLLGVVRGAGFPDREAILATTTLVNWASGWAVFEVRDPVGPAASEDERQRYLAEMRAYFAQLPADRYPHTTATIGIGFEVTPDEQFAYGLERLLDGISRDLERT